MKTSKTPNKVPSKKPGKELTGRVYDKTLHDLQVELVKMQEWVVATGAKIVVIFEGRDAAGKGGVADGTRNVRAMANRPHAGGHRSPRPAG